MEVFTMNYRLFIGSSAEHLDYAESIQLNLSHIKNLDVVCWSQNVIRVGRYPLDDLLLQLEQMSFGVFVLAPDDYIKIREQNYYCVRDNVLFEMGMFYGALGRERTFFVAPEDDQNSYRIPSDLAGITYAKYKLSEQNDRDMALGPACTQIKRMIQEQMTKFTPKDIIEKYGIFSDFDSLYKDMFATATSITTSFIHSRRWRENNMSFIAQFFKRENVHWDVVLPDISNRYLVAHLKRHFSDGRDMVAKILDAYSFFNDYAKKYPNKITIRSFFLYPTYTLYKFDNKMIISLYPLTSERKPTPTFLVDSTLQYHSFFQDDVKDLLSQTICLTTQEIDNLIERKKV